MKEYRCDRCGCRFLTTQGGDRMDKCRNTGCDGTPKRVWTTNFNRVPGGGRAALLLLIALGLPLVTPWPTCARFPIRCDPTQDPFATTTTWKSKTP